MRMKSVIFLAATILISGCGQKGPKVTEPTDNEAEQVLAIGQDLSGKLMSGLLAELNAALQEGGPELAIGFCHLRAIPFTDSLNIDSSEGNEVKRTTFNYRNPENAPNAFEKLALEYYEGLAAEEESLPPYYVQKISDRGAAFFYYYRPLRVAGLCLNCHGDPAEMNEKVVSAIRLSYPDDRATGYKEGDFRGLIRVKVELER